MEHDEQGNHITRVEKMSWSPRHISPADPDFYFEDRL